MQTSRCLRRLLLLGAAVCMGFGLPERLAGQDSTRIMSAALLRRIAEAVDGNRTGEPVFVVVMRQGGYWDVPAAFPTRQAAQGYASDHPGTEWFGPYISPPDEMGSPQQYLLAGCKHDGTLTRYYCPPRDSLRSGSVPMAQVAEVIITVRTKDGVDHTQHYDPQHADAFFFTMSAIDKFVIPYYTWVYDASYAARLRQQSLDLFSGPTGR